MSDITTAILPANTAAESAIQPTAASMVANIINDDDLLLMKKMKEEQGHARGDADADEVTPTAIRTTTIATAPPTHCVLLGELKPIAIADLAPNAAVKYFLENPRSKPRWCMRRGHHDIDACTFLHRNAALRPLYVTIRGEPAPVPVAHLIPNRGLERLQQTMANSLARYQELVAAAGKEKEEEEAPIADDGNIGNDDDEDSNNDANNIAKHSGDGGKNLSSATFKNDGEGEMGEWCTIASPHDITHCKHLHLAKVPDDPTVNVEGEDTPICLSHLLLNRGASYLLTFPEAKGVWCNNKIIHDVLACPYVHRRVDGHPKVVIVEEEKFPVPISQLITNKALRFLLDNPQCTGRWCGRTMKHDVDGCTYLHRTHPFVRVDGDSVRISTLKSNRGLKYLLEHPEAQGHWCHSTTHDEAHPIETCTFIHLKDESRQRRMAEQHARSGAAMTLGGGNGTAPHRHNNLDGHQHQHTGGGGRFINHTHNSNSHPSSNKTTPHYAYAPAPAPAYTPSSASPSSAPHHHHRQPNSRHAGNNHQHHGANNAHMPTPPHYRSSPNAGNAANAGAILNHPTTRSSFPTAPAATAVVAAGSHHQHSSHHHHSSSPSMGAAVNIGAPSHQQQHRGGNVNNNTADNGSGNSFNNRMTPNHHNNNSNNNAGASFKGNQQQQQSHFQQNVVGGGHNNGGLVGTAMNATPPPTAFDSNNTNAGYGGSQQFFQQQHYGNNSGNNNVGPNTSSSNSNFTPNHFNSDMIANGGGGGGFNNSSSSHGNNNLMMMAHAPHQQQQQQQQAANASPVTIGYGSVHHQPAQRHQTQAAAPSYHMGNNGYHQNNGNANNNHHQQQQQQQQIFNNNMNMNLNTNSGTRNNAPSAMPPSVSVSPFGRTVTISGQPMSAELLLNNPGLQYLLNNPHGSDGRFCTRLSDPRHRADICNYIHRI